MPVNKMGDSRWTETQALRSLVLRLAVADKLDDSSGSAIRSSGFLVWASMVCLFKLRKSVYYFRSR